MESHCYSVDILIISPVIPLFFFRPYLHVIKCFTGYVTASYQPVQHLSVCAEFFILSYTAL